MNFYLQASVNVDKWSISFAILLLSRFLCIVILFKYLCRKLRNQQKKHGNLGKLQSFSDCLCSRITNIKMNTAWVYIKSNCIFIVPFEYGDLLAGVLFSVVFVTLSGNLVTCDTSRRNFMLGRKSIHLCRNCCFVGRFGDCNFIVHVVLRRK